jgi:hypothetical protein
MKTLRVTLDFTMNVPDEWRIVGIEKPEVGCIEIDGTRYEPDLMWMKVIDTDMDTAESEQVDDDTHLLLMEHVVSCTISVNCDEDGEARASPLDAS